MTAGQAGTPPVLPTRQHNHERNTEMTDTTPDPTMTNADRQALIRIVKARAKQAEREAEMREKIVYADVIDQMTAEFEARDALWADAVAIAEEAAAKANAQIQARCVELGIPPKRAPGLIWAGGPAAMSSLAGTDAQSCASSRRPGRPR